MRFPLLALLANGPAHGYELKQALEQRDIEAVVTRRLLRARRRG